MSVQRIWNEFLRSIEDDQIADAKKHARKLFDLIDEGHQPPRILKILPREHPLQGSVLHFVIAPYLIERSPIEPMELDFDCSAEGYEGGD